MMRLPLTVWGLLTAASLQIVALPVLTAGGLLQLGPGQHQRGRAVERRDQRRGHPALQRLAQRSRHRGGERMAQQRRPARAGEARGERVGLGDVRRARRRGGRRGGGQRHGGRVEGASVQHPRHRARGRAGEQLPALHGAEAVPLQHPHHADRPLAGPCGQRRPQLP